MISLIMVMGVSIVRWSLPALILGTSSIPTDLGRAPHLGIWAILAGGVKEEQNVGKRVYWKVVTRNRN
jgi:hypothetical protein